jgi:hypothetical protein
MKHALCSFNLKVLNNLVFWERSGVWCNSIGQCTTAFQFRSISILTRPKIICCSLKNVLIFSSFPVHKSRVIWHDNGTDCCYMRHRVQPHPGGNLYCRHSLCSCICLHKGTVTAQHNASYILRPWQCTDAAISCMQTGTAVSPVELQVEVRDFLLHTTNKTPWPESASEVYRPSDRRLSATEIRKLFCKKYRFLQNENSTHKRRGNCKVRVKIVSLTLLQGRLV